MRHTRIRAFVPALALVLAVAASAWADCAPFISTGINSGPATGELIGTETRTDTETVSTTVTGSGSVGIPGTNTSGSTTVTTTKTSSRTYQVGTYEMSDGSRLEVDCSNYTLV